MHDSSTRRVFLSSLAAAGVTIAWPAATHAQRYQTNRQLMPLVEPGAVIGAQAPQGWTHILIKSSPICNQGDVRQINQTHVRMASLLTTSLVAEVRRSRREPHPFILNRVAGAVSKDIDGKDVAITPETQKQLGANLGILEGVLLREFVKQQKTVAFIARGANLAVFDTPIVLRVGGANGSNVEKVLRYAVVVDPQTGRLDTFCWTIGLEAGKLTQVEGAMQWLPPNHTIQCNLWVDKGEINFVGVPSKKAFACISIPQGQFQIRVDRTPGAVALLSKPQYTEKDCQQIEGWLGSIVAQHARQAARR